jgi:hypothetical protein
MQKELGREVDYNEVKLNLKKHFAARFNFEYNQ